jgi:hypothetical protein
MSLVSAGGFLPTNSLERIIQTNPQKIIFIFSLLLSMLNFFLIFNLFDKKIIIREHREDFYLISLSIIFISLVYLDNYNGLNIIMGVISSLSNSGLSLINSDNNLSLYFILISAVGGSLISNTSGIKMTRVYILIKTAISEVNKLISPNSITNKNIFNSEKKNNC